MGRFMIYRGRWNPGTRSYCVNWNHFCRVFALSRERKIEDSLKLNPRFVHIVISNLRVPMVRSVGRAVSLKWKSKRLG